MYSFQTIQTEHCHKRCHLDVKEIMENCLKNSSNVDGRGAREGEGGGCGVVWCGVVGGGEGGGGGDNPGKLLVLTCVKACP